jgi:hypothetical protein
MSEQPRYHSSGEFTLDVPAQDQRLGQNSLEDPALAPLWLVRAVVRAGADGASLRLSRDRVIMRLRLKGPYQRPDLLARVDQLWQPGEQQHGQVVEWSWKRAVSKARLQSEKQWLRERARFCPIPFKLNGYILQPENFEWQSGGGLLARDYHLAEFFFGGSGLSLFRPDAPSGGRLNSSRTFWRECEAGVEKLRWWMPWRVAGQVARLKACQGWRFGWAGLLGAQPGQPSQALAVHEGVLVWSAPLDWPELPGTCLLFDASELQLDLSGLKLLESSGLKAHLENCRLALRAKVEAALPRWGGMNRSHGVTSRQNRKEAGAWLSIWSATLVTGVAVYLPLPLLGLPWILWHHQSRKRIFQIWRQRLQELGAAGIESPAGG